MYSIAFFVAPFCRIMYPLCSSLSNFRLSWFIFWKMSPIPRLYNPDDDSSHVSSAAAFLQELETFGGTDQGLNLVPGKFYCLLLLRVFKVQELCDWGCSSEYFKPSLALSPVLCLYRVSFVVKLCVLPPPTGLESSRLLFSVAELCKNRHKIRARDLQKTTNSTYLT